ncbi:hypothetical protein PC116_g25860 [Phytophthora cactorum]|uniref:Uncharacterized protein n=1 Tax=Phytophthora cactorum TaxID=29920 RepID=A0A8T0Y099_9STRA|nr:hypothetical protein PC111_g21282 [Phytophthora cactorum]KAG2827696.1 hypothetical protein PC113_g21583 [Phytophthora cactorum]KAG2884156.1 hypothetical protein PC115_g21411 [Phytophthora cactorum]KAG4225720.1 hypothetical protein PC116_g25860 [Phytophthora cactorum]
MTDGVLPSGFLSSDTPLQLYDIEMCVTNLCELPDGLDVKWLLGSCVVVEHSQLRSVPASLLRLMPSYLSLMGNPISSLPPEIFEIEGMADLGIGDTNIRELPQNVTQLSSTLTTIYMSDTDVSYFCSLLLVHTFTKRSRLLHSGRRSLILLVAVVHDAARENELRRQQDVPPLTPQVSSQTRRRRHRRVLQFVSMDDDWREDGSLRGLNAGGAGKGKARGKGKGPQFTRVIPKFLQKYHQPPAIQAKFATLPKPGEEEDEGLDEVQQAAIDEYLAQKKEKAEERNKKKEASDGEEEGEENDKDLKKKSGQTVVQMGKDKGTASNGTKKKKRKRADQPTLSNKKLLSFSMDNE